MFSRVIFSCSHSGTEIVHDICFYPFCVRHISLGRFASELIEFLLKILISLVRLKFVSVAITRHSPHRDLRYDIVMAKIIMDISVIFCYRPRIHSCGSFEGVSVYFPAAVAESFGDEVGKSASAALAHDPEDSITVSESLDVSYDFISSPGEREMFTRRLVFAVNHEILSPALLFHSTVFRITLDHNSDQGGSGSVSEGLPAMRIIAGFRIRLRGAVKGYIRKSQAFKKACAVGAGILRVCRGQLHRHKRKAVISDSRILLKPAV